MTDSIECGTCRVRLTEEYAGTPRKPCPNCGATNRNFSVFVSMKVGVSVSAIASQRFGHTGREVLGADAERRAARMQGGRKHHCARLAGGRRAVYNKSPFRLPLAA